MIEISLAALTRCVPSLQALATAQRVMKIFNPKLEKEVDLLAPLDMLRSHVVSKVLDACNKELELYEKVRVDKVTQYGHDVEKEIDGSVQQVKEVTPENAAKFNEEHQALLDSTVQIDVEKLTHNNFSDVNLDPLHKLALKWIFSE